MTERRACRKLPQEANLMRQAPYRSGTGQARVTPEEGQAALFTKTASAIRSHFDTNAARRGVLLFLNDGILAERVLPGEETEDEIIVVAKNPLSIDVIAGVEPLSPADRLALLG